MNDEKKISGGMSEVVKTVCNILEGFIFVFGCYIVLYGQLSPGGGFAGGVILAAVFILIMLAFGKERILKIMPRKRGAFIEALGALAFLAVAWAGLYVSGIFFKNFIPTTAASHFNLMSGGTILICNIAIALKVMAGLFLVFFVLSITRVVLEGDKLKMVKKQ
ncbi:hypothetical protein KKF70_00355 [bacterium]|nr:hypothetical protein [Candidatus Omnitrophota bacterium]MBU2527824.1 hypothetical protein [bacterium]MBU3930739.1 hypothetical protein [bacterium]MBU4122895.1 hypothetical protein [bacterium]